MSQSTRKYIGINQRVPFTILDQGLMRYLRDGVVDRTMLRQDLSEFTQGENRLSKAVGYAYQILTKSTTLLTTFRKALSVEAYLQLPEHERQAFCVSLVSCTYPIAYDVVVAFAIGFKVQSRISRQYVAERIGNKYGSTRTIDIALDALMPMMIELGITERSETSIYRAKENQPISNTFISEAYVFADLKASNHKSLLANEITSRPWYLFYIPSIGLGQSSTLLKHTEGYIGGGYISTK
jgi:hypothetical protein